MKNMCFWACVLLTLPALAQHSDSLQNKVPSIKPAVEEIVKDYFLGFSNVRGAQVFENTVRTDFACMVSVPGAITQKISRYKTPGTYSWQALLMQTEVFQDAADYYQKIYRQLSTGKIAISKVTQYDVSGWYDAPNESKGFSATHLELLGATEGPGKMYIAIEMGYQFPKWNVNVSVYEKIPDADIRPRSGYREAGQ